MAPRWPKRAPRRAQERPKTGPRAPKSTPRAVQERLKKRFFRTPWASTDRSSSLFCSTSTGIRHLGPSWGHPGAKSPHVHAHVSGPDGVYIDTHPFFCLISTGIRHLRPSWTFSGPLGAILDHVGEKCCGDGLRWRIPIDVEQKRVGGPIYLPPSGVETYACTFAPLAPPLPNTDAPTPRGTPPPGPGGGGKGEG